MLILILGVGKLCVDLDRRHGPSWLAGLPRSLRLLLPFEWQRPSPLLLNLPRFQQPLRKYSLAIILHVVTGEEDGSHGIQQVLVVVQVLFVLDELELELLLDVLVLQRLIGAEIGKEVVEEIVGFGAQGVLHVLDGMLLRLADSTGKLLILATETDGLELLLHLLTVLDRKEWPSMKLVLSYISLHFLVILLVFFYGSLMIEHLDVCLLHSAALPLLAYPTLALVVAR